MELNFGRTNALTAKDVEAFLRDDTFYRYAARVAPFYRRLNLDLLESPSQDCRNDARRAFSPDAQPASCGFKVWPACLCRLINAA